VHINFILIINYSDVLFIIHNDFAIKMMVLPTAMPIILLGSFFFNCYKIFLFQQFVFECFNIGIF